MTALVTDNLPLVSGAPGGIAKLRDLILDLAIRGKLTKRAPTDEPVSDLLAQIESARTSLARSKRASAGTDAAPPPFEIPRGWAWIRLGDLLSKIGAGSTPLGGKQAYVDVGVKFLRSQNVWNEGLRLDDVALISAETHARMSGTHVQPGDILFNITGASIGRCALVPDSFDTGNVSQHVTIIRPLLGSTRRYLHAALMSKLVQDTVMAVQVGVSREGLSIGKLAQFYVPLPPLAEQDRIVAKVDELMALCDRLEAEQADAEAAHAKLVEALLASLTQARGAADFRTSWQQLAEHFHTLFTTEASVDALKQTVMQLGVEGRLCAGVARSTWRLQTINEFCTVQGGIQKTPLRAPVKHHFPYLRVANVQRGRIDTAQLERYELAAEELQRWRLNAGDLLIVEGNGSESEIGRCAIWHGEVEDCVYQNHLMRVRPTGGDAVEYLALYLNSPVGTAHMRRLAITTSGLFNLSVGKIRSIPVELPPPSEQRRIVAEVNELLTLCDQLKQRLATSRQAHEHLATVLVEQAMN